jgi:hypothetical protein
MEKNNKVGTEDQVKFETGPLENLDYALSNVDVSMQRDLNNLR